VLPLFADFVRSGESTLHTGRPETRLANLLLRPTGTRGGRTRRNFVGALDCCWVPVDEMLEEADVNEEVLQKWPCLRFADEPCNASGLQMQEWQPANEESLLWQLLALVESAELALLDLGLLPSGVCFRPHATAPV